VIVSLARFGVRTLVFSGGEPFLRPDLPKLIQIATREGLAVTVTTNGTLLDAKILQLLGSTGLSCLVVSFDSLKADLYRAIRQIPAKRPLSSFLLLQSLRRAGLQIPRVAVNAVLTRANYRDITDHVQAVSELLLPDDAIMLQPYQPPPFLEASRDPLRFGPSDLPVLEALCQSLIEGLARGWKIGNDCGFLRRMPRFLAAGELSDQFQCLTA
jgi:MoaA/NifB/PqqE/SkfB family radical SAM enzyme